MPKYDYVALDQKGKETKGSVEAASQNEAIGRVKDMQLFPTKIVETEKVQEKKAAKQKSRPRSAGGKKRGAWTCRSTLKSPAWAARSNRRC